MSATKHPTKHPNSRWVSGKVPRYDQRELIGVVKKYHEGDGWRNGARVRKVK